MNLSTWGDLEANIMAQATLIIIVSHHTDVTFRTFFLVIDVF